MSYPHGGKSGGNRPGTHQDDTPADRDDLTQRIDQVVNTTNVNPATRKSQGGRSDLDHQGGGPAYGSALISHGPRTTPLRQHGRATTLRAGHDRPDHTPLEHDDIRGPSPDDE